jgi:hypothetical protein
VVVHLTHNPMIGDSNLASGGGDTSRMVYNSNCNPKIKSSNPTNKTQRWGMC